MADDKVKNQGDEPEAEAGGPFTEYDQERLASIRDAARAAGDKERADIAHMLIWAQEIVDRSLDVTTALAREVRRVFPVLALTLDGDGSLVSAATEALRSMVVNILDNVAEEPEVTTEDGGLFRVTKSHWALRAQVESLQKTLGPAPNFVQVDWTTEDGPFIVTVQRPGGKSPHQLLTEEKERGAQLEAVLRAAGLDVPGRNDV